jgi:hypothetical protein
MWNVHIAIIATTSNQNKLNGRSISEEIKIHLVNLK